MKFKYVGFNKEGKKVKGIIEASDIQEAKQKLSDIAIIDIKQKRAFNISFGSVKKSELAKILNVIGLYLKASIPLKKAIHLAKSHTYNNKMIKFLDFLQKEIESGKSLTKALQEQNIVKLPQYVIHSINVAENSGNLDLVMIELSKFIQDEEKINSKASQAMIYPVFILSISFVLLIVMLTTVVPKIVKIFNSLNRKLPKITQIVINTSDFVKNNYIFIIVFTISFIIIFKIIYTKNKKFKLLIHSLFLKLPIINRLIITKELSRFSYMTYTLTKSGINFINAINLAANTIQNEKIKQIFIKALNEVKEGKSFSISLKKYNFPDKSFVESLALAEETGEIKEIMKNLNEIYFEEYQNKTSTLLSLLEPVMMLIVGGIIGFIVTAMLLPIFNMNMIH